MTNLNYSQSCNCFHVPISVNNNPFAYSPERLKVLTKFRSVLNPGPGPQNNKNHKYFSLNKLVVSS